jgi:hypothetical protein
MQLPQLRRAPNQKKIPGLRLGRFLDTSEPKTHGPPVLAFAGARQVGH